jgi:hypothetical protein
MIMVDDDCGDKDYNCGYYDVDRVDYNSGYYDGDDDYNGGNNT